MCIFVVCQSYTLRAPSLQKKNFKDKLVKEGVHGGNAAKNLAKNQNPTISIAIPKVILHNFSGEVFLLLHCTTHTIYIWADLGAKYLAFFSSFLKTRKKNISFAQFVYFLREVCLLAIRCCFKQFQKNKSGAKSLGKFLFLKIMLSAIFL